MALDTSIKRDGSPRDQTDINLALGKTRNGIGGYLQSAFGDLILPVRLFSAKRGAKGFSDGATVASLAMPPQGMFIPQGRQDFIAAGRLPA